MTVNAPPTLADQCAQKISLLIRQGKYSSGERLSEIRLSEELDMGRAPVRAALDKLAQGGLVIRIPRAGTFVARVTMEEYRDLMEIRESLEALAARHAARRISPPQIIELRRMAQNYEEERRQADPHFNHGKLIELDRIFHLRLAEHSRNREAYHILRDQNILERSFLNELHLGRIFWEEYPHDYPTHLDIVEAIARHNPEEAEGKIRAHIAAAREAQVRALF